MPERDIRRRAPVGDGVQRFGAILVLRAGVDSSERDQIEGINRLLETAYVRNVQPAGIGPRPGRPFQAPRPRAQQRAARQSQNAGLHRHPEQNLHGCGHRRTGTPRVIQAAGVEDLSYGHTAAVIRAAAAAGGGRPKTPMLHYGNWSPPRRTSTCQGLLGHTVVVGLIRVMVRQKTLCKVIPH